jgi:hypothetical protein
MKLLTVGSFYEPNMITNVTPIWKKAAGAAWGTAKCVAASLPHINETATTRKRKSEETKERARLEGRRMIRKQDLVALPKSPIHGKKVPWI